MNHLHEPREGIIRVMSAAAIATFVAGDVIFDHAVGPARTAA